MARLRVRSWAMRRYLALAYPCVAVDATVTFGPGARIRAFDGGSVRIGARTWIGDHALVEASGGRLAIGRDGAIGRGCVIVAREAITLGDGVLVAEHVTIRDQDHRFAGPAPLAAQGFDSAPIHIGDHVWLAAKVTVTRGVDIAAHCVVGANSVVTRSLPKRGAYAGTPARPIGAGKVVS